MSKVLTDQIEKRTGGTAIDIPAAGKWPTANIADDAIGAAQIATDAVTADAIAANAVTSSEIADDAVTIAKLAATGTAQAGTYLQGNNTWGGIAVTGFNDVEAVTGTGVYTVPTGITKLLVIITGGGGSGSAGITATAHGGGGCSAGTVMARVTVVATDTITIAIGAGGIPTANVNSAVGNVGGDSTFTHTSGSGSFDTITAPGGRAGVLYNTMNAVPVAPTVGASNEGIAIKGGAPSGDNNGGASFWGSGGAHGLASISLGNAGVAFGSGGGGGTYTAGLYTGQAGCDGVCFIMEFK
jgi:hypothetical protein